MSLVIGSRSSYRAFGASGRLDSRKCIVLMVSGPSLQPQRSSSVTPIQWRKVRRRECPNKISIRWWGVYVSYRVFALSILLKNSFVIDDAEFSFSHSSLYYCLRKLWIGSLAFNQDILEFLICVLGHPTLYNVQICYFNKLMRRSLIYLNDNLT